MRQYDRGAGWPRLSRFTLHVPHQPHDSCPPMRGHTTTTANSNPVPHASPRPVPADTLVLGRYRLGPRLGAGGMGVVWLAHDERLDRAVAVKRVPVDPDDASVERDEESAFRNEE